MDTVDETNSWRPRSFGFCSPSLLKNIDYIIHIFEKSFKRDEIIKKYEYRKYLMIITNNCNWYIEKHFPIDKIQLEKSKIQLEKRKQEEKEKIRAENTITGYDNVDIYIDDTTDLNIKFEKSDNDLTYEEVFNKNHLLNDTYNDVIFKISAGLYKTFYVRIDKKNDNEFNIKDFITGEILNDLSFNFKSFLSGSSGTEVGTTVTYPFTSIAIINDNVKAEQYNKDHYQPGGGILSKNKGKKGVYKSTKQKISVIIDKKSCDRTVYKNAKGISYIRCNNEYKLLKKYKLVKK